MVNLLAHQGGGVGRAESLNLVSLPFGKGDLPL